MPEFKELTGGVSSEIWKVGEMCVKRALPRLRVAQQWEAPIARNRYERLWLETAGRAAPRFAAQVGRPLPAIHTATAGRPDIAERFATDAIFYAIRLEPYLVFTGQIYAELGDRFDYLATRTAKTRVCLVHGDVSPKNILVGASGPVFLDAECAWYGDPAFDLAFCLNHLLLKCLWIPRAKEAFLACFDAMTATYLRSVRWEPATELERRTARLLPGLFLGRVDGKSPVEYLTDERERERVRRVARALLAEPAGRLEDVREAWARE